MEIIKENKENENLNFLQKILNEYGIVQSSEPSESYNFVLEEINSVENKEIIFNSDKFHRRLLILSRKSENYKAEKETFAGELFVTDDRFKDDIIDIFYAKKLNNYELYKCPFCGSYTNVVEKTYYDNNGVVGSALVCPYCWDIERRDVNTEEKIRRHFHFIKKDILNKRLNK